MTHALTMSDGAEGQFAHAVALQDTRNKYAALPWRVRGGQGGADNAAQPDACHTRDKSFRERAW